TSRDSIVGTSIAWLIPSSWTVNSHSGAVKFGRYIIRRPAKVFVSTVPTPAMWYGGTLMSAASSSSAAANSTVWSTEETRGEGRGAPPFGLVGGPPVFHTTPR